jgi:hypothetical protein
MPSFPELRPIIIEKADAARALICPTSENGRISFKIICARDSRKRKTSASSLFLFCSRRAALNGIAAFPKSFPRIIREQATDL